MTCDNSHGDNPAMPTLSVTAPIYIQDIYKGQGVTGIGAVSSFFRDSPLQLVTAQNPKLSQPLDYGRGVVGARLFVLALLILAVLS